MASSRYDLKSISRDDLIGFVSEHVRTLTEEEALAILDNPYVTPAIIQKMAHVERLAAYYSVRRRMVAHRLTPQAYAVKFVHYLYWFDLVRLSVEVMVPAPVRRAIDTRLLTRVGELSVGERVAWARRCSSALIKHFLFDQDSRVFEALLLNQRVREDDLVALASSPRARPESLALLGSDAKWSYRYAIRKALVLNPLTPRATAAAQLRYLPKRDLRALYLSPQTSVYLRRCIERLREHAVEAAARKRNE
jgi:hypothetical protein